MASTNKTTHYNLSQYIGNDKPTYLVDYNTDMSNIDTGIYNAQGKADSNESNIGNLANLTTSVKTSLVNAINELNSNDGDLSTLETTDKTSLVNAINEVNSNSNTNTSNIGDLSTLETSIKTSLVNAINELFYKNGDTYSNSNIYPSIGWTTGGSKSLTFLVTLPKSIKNINTISVTNYDITARDVSGNYALSRVTSGYTVTATKIDDHNVSIYMESTTALPTTNNTPLAIAIYHLTLSFS